MLVKINKFLSDKQLESLDGIMRVVPPIDGKDTAGSEFKDKKSSKVYVSGSIAKTIFDTSTQEVVSSQVTCGEFAPLETTIATYKKGDFYDWHLDQMFYGGKTSKVAFTIWLNNPDEYEGGCLKIKHDYGIERLKEPAGTAVFYPTGMLHKVTEVTSGKRNVVVGVLDCFIGSPHHRYIITELSKSINDLWDYIQVTQCDSDPLQSLEDVFSRLRYVEAELKRRNAKL